MHNASMATWVDVAQALLHVIANKASAWERREVAARGAQTDRC